MADAPRSWLPSGYDENFVSAVENDNICLICHLPLKEPVLTRCGHRFCKECLKEHFRRQGAQDQPLTCPADREGLDRDRDVFPDKATERKILSFAIKCPSKGCDWTGELRSKEDHIGQCCKFPVSCPNSCGALIPREMIPNHTDYDCSLTIISCPYEKMGCETKVQRVQVESHLQSAMRLHLDLACVKLTNTEVKLNDTEAKLNDTEAELNETKVKLNETEKKLEATRKVVEKLDTRIFTWRINNFSLILRQAETGEKISKDSVPFYTDRTESYGYRLKLRIHPKGNCFF